MSGEDRPGERDDAEAQPQQPLTDPGAFTALAWAVLGLSAVGMVTVSWGYLGLGWLRPFLMSSLVLMILFVKALVFGGLGLPAWMQLRTTRNPVCVGSGAVMTVCLALIWTGLTAIYLAFVAHSLASELAAEKGPARDVQLLNYAMGVLCALWGIVLLASLALTITHRKALLVPRAKSGGKQVRRTWSMLRKKEFAVPVCITALWVAITVPGLVILMRRVHTVLALSQAIQRGDVGKVRECLDRWYLDARIRAFEEGTLLHEAALAGQDKVARLLLARGVDVNDRNAAGQTALFVALLANHPGVARTLMEAGAKLDIFGAAGLGETDVVRKLLAADPRCARAKGGYDKRKSDHFVTPLHFAAAGKHVEAVKLLLAAGADSNGDGSAWTPLAMAVQHGGTETVKALLAGGADPNVGERRSGWTPLHYAAAARRPQIAVMLLAAGAKADVRNAKDQTPLDLAKAGGNAATIQVLERAMGK